MARALSFALLCVAALPAGGAAQGFGHRRLRCDVQPLTPRAANGNTVDDGLLGVQWLAGELFVTGRDAANLAGRHSIYVLNAACQLVRAFDQPAYTAASLWGFRDGMSDGAGLAFGFEDGIGFVNAAGAPLATFGGVAIGSQPLVFSGYTAGLVYRALAFDPVAASVFVGDFASAIHEFDLATGNLLNTWPNLSGSAAWNAFGFALDPQLTTAGEAALWVNGDDGSNAIRLYRLPRTGLGAVAVATSSIIARDQPLSSVGGLSELPGGTPGMPTTSLWDLVALDQGTSDVVSSYRVHLYTGCDGSRDAYLVAGSGLTFANATQDRAKVGVVPFHPADWVYWDFIEPNGAPRLGAVWANAKVTGLDETDDRLSTLLDPSFEFRVAWGGSVPQGFFPLVLGPNLTAGGGPSGFPVPIGIFKIGDGFRIQGFFLDLCHPSWPVVATNQTRFVAQSGFRRPVRVIAEGSDSFDADTSRGFWRIYNEDRFGRTITSVALDWTNSTNVQQATMRFDTDQTGMNDLFEGGNGATPGCLGTYRNGCDATTGLVYDASCTTPATPCNPAALTGWIGTNAGPNIDDWRTLEFRFTGFQAGERFEFDCDTDGGQGLTGRDMAGLRVTVRLSDNSTLVGVLAASGFQQALVTL